MKIGRLEKESNQVYTIEDVNSKYVKIETNSGYGYFSICKSTEQLVRDYVYISMRNRNFLQVGLNENVIVSPIEKLMDIETIIINVISKNVIDD